MSKKTYYEILGVDSEARLPEIRKAFRLVASQHHPDKSNSASSKEIYYKATEALDILKDQETRDKYDLWLAGGQKGSFEDYKEGRQIKNEYDERLRLIIQSIKNKTNWSTAYVDDKLNQLFEEDEYRYKELYDEKLVLVANDKNIIDALENIREETNDYTSVHTDAKEDIMILHKRANANVMSKENFTRKINRETQDDSDSTKNEMVNVSQRIFIGVGIFLFILFLLILGGG